MMSRSFKSESSKCESRMSSKIWESSAEESTNLQIGRKWRYWENLMKKILNFTINPKPLRSFIHRPLLLASHSRPWYVIVLNVRYLQSYVFMKSKLMYWDLMFTAVMKKLSHVENLVHCWLTRLDDCQRTHTLPASNDLIDLQVPFILVIAQ